jgi:hypothetical protein
VGDNSLIVGANGGTRAVDGGSQVCDDRGTLHSNL